MEQFMFIIPKQENGYLEMKMQPMQTPENP